MALPEPPLASAAARRPAQLAAALWGPNAAQTPSSAAAAPHTSGVTGAPERVLGRKAEKADVAGRAAGWVVGRTDTLRASTTSEGKMSDEGLVVEERSLRQTVGPAAGDGAPDGALCAPIQTSGGERARSSASLLCKTPEQHQLIMSVDTVEGPLSAAAAASAAVVALDPIMTASTANADTNATAAAGTLRGEPHTSATLLHRGVAAGTLQAPPVSAISSSIAAAMRSGTPAAFAAAPFSPLSLSYETAFSDSVVTVPPAAHFLSCSRRDVAAACASARMCAAAGAAAPDLRHFGSTKSVPQKAVAGVVRRGCGGVGIPTASAATENRRRGGRTGGAAAHASAAAAANSPTNLWLTLQSGRRGWSYPPPFVSHYSPQLPPSESLQQKYGAATKSSVYGETLSTEVAARFRLWDPTTSVIQATPGTKKHRSAARATANDLAHTLVRSTQTHPACGVSLEEWTRSKVAPVRAGRGVEKRSDLCVRALTRNTAAALAAQDTDRSEPFIMAGEHALVGGSGEPVMTVGMSVDGVATTTGGGSTSAAAAAAAKPAGKNILQKEGGFTEANEGRSVWERGNSSCSTCFSEGTNAAESVAEATSREERVCVAEGVERFRSPELDGLTREENGNKWQSDSNDKTVTSSDGTAGSTERLSSPTSMADIAKREDGRMEGSSKDVCSTPSSSSQASAGNTGSFRRGSNSRGILGDSGDEGVKSYSGHWGSTNSSRSQCDRMQSNLFGVDIGSHSCGKEMESKAVLAVQQEQDPLLLEKFHYEKEAARLYCTQQKQSAGWLYDTRQQQQSQVLFPAFEDEDWWRCSKPYELRAQAVWDIKSTTASSSCAPGSSLTSLVVSLHAATSLVSSLLYPRGENCLDAASASTGSTVVAPLSAHAAAVEGSSPRPLDARCSATASQQHQQQPGATGAAVGEVWFSSRRKSRVVFPPPSPSARATAARSPVSSSSSSRSTLLWDAAHTHSTTAALTTSSTAAAEVVTPYTLSADGPRDTALLRSPSVLSPALATGTMLRTSREQISPGGSGAAMTGSIRKSAATQRAATTAGTVTTAGLGSGREICSRKVRVYLDGLGSRGVNGGHAGGGWTRAGGGGVFAGGVARYFSQKLRCCWERPKQQQQVLLRPLPVTTATVRADEEDEDLQQEDEEQRPPFGCSFRGRGHFGCVNAISFSTDGELLASGSDDTRVLLWRATGAKKVRNDLDETTLLRGGAADLPMRLRLLRLRELGGASYQASFLFSGHTQAIAAMEGGTLETFDFRHRFQCRERHGLGQVVERTLASVLSVAVHPLDDFLFAFCCCPKAALCDIRKNKAVCILKEPIRYCTTWPPPSASDSKSRPQAGADYHLLRRRKPRGGSSTATHEQQQSFSSFSARPGRRRGVTLLREAGVSIPSRELRRPAATDSGVARRRQAGTSGTSARAGDSGGAAAQSATGGSGLLSERYLRRRQRTVERTGNDAFLAILDAPYGSSGADDIVSVREVGTATGSDSRPSSWRFAVHLPLSLQGASAARAEGGNETRPFLQEQHTQQTQQAQIPQEQQQQEEKQMKEQGASAQDMYHETEHVRDDQTHVVLQQQQGVERQEGGLGGQHRPQGVLKQQQHQQGLPEQQPSERQNPLERGSHQQRLQYKSSREAPSCEQQSPQVQAEYSVTVTPAAAVGNATKTANGAVRSGSPEAPQLGETAAAPASNTFGEGTAPAEVTAIQLTSTVVAASTESASGEATARADTSALRGALAIVTAPTGMSRAAEGEISGAHGLAEAEVLMEETDETGGGVRRCKRPRRSGEQQRHEREEALQMRECNLDLQDQQQGQQEANKNEQPHQQQTRINGPAPHAAGGSQGERKCERRIAQGTRLWQAEESPASPVRRSRRRLSSSESGDGSADAGADLWGECVSPPAPTLRAELLGDLASAALLQTEGTKPKDEVLARSTGERNGDSSMSENGGCGSSETCTTNDGSRSNSKESGSSSASSSSSATSGSGTPDLTDASSRNFASASNEGLGSGESSSSSDGVTAACRAVEDNNGHRAFPCNITASSSSSCPPTLHDSGEANGRSSPWMETTIADDQQPGEALTTVLQRVRRRNQRGAFHVAVGAHLPAYRALADFPVATCDRVGMGETPAEDSASLSAAPCTEYVETATRNRSEGDTAGTGGYVSDPEEFSASAGYTDLFETSGRPPASPTSRSSFIDTEEYAGHDLTSAGDWRANSTTRDTSASLSTRAAASSDLPPAAGGELRSGSGRMEEMFSYGPDDISAQLSHPLYSRGESVWRAGDGEDTAEEDVRLLEAALPTLQSRTRSSGNRNRGSSSASSRSRQGTAGLIAQMELQLDLQALRARMEREVTTLAASGRRRLDPTHEESVLERELTTVRKHKEDSAPLRGADRVVFSWSGRLMLIIRRRRFPLVYLTGHPLPIFELRSEGWRNFMTLKAGCFLFDDRHIAIGSEDKRVHVWRLPDVIDVDEYVKHRYTQVLQSVFCLRGHSSIVNCCASTPPVTRSSSSAPPLLASCGIERMIRFWLLQRAGEGDKDDCLFYPPDNLYVKDESLEDEVVILRFNSAARRMAVGNERRMARIRETGAIVESSSSEEEEGGDMEEDNSEENSDTEEEAGDGEAGSSNESSESGGGESGDEGGGEHNGEERMTHNEAVDMERTEDRRAGGEDDPSVDTEECRKMQRSSSSSNSSSSSRLSTSNSRSSCNSSSSSSSAKASRELAVSRARVVFRLGAVSSREALDSREGGQSSTGGVPRAEGHQDDEQYFVEEESGRPRAGERGSTVDVAAVGLATDAAAVRGQAGVPFSLKRQAACCVEGAPRTERGESPKEFGVENEVEANLQGTPQGALRKSQQGGPKRGEEDVAEVQKEMQWEQTRRGTEWDQAQPPERGNEGSHAEHCTSHFTSGSSHELVCALGEANKHVFVVSGAEPPGKSAAQEIFARHINVSSSYAAAGRNGSSASSTGSASGSNNTETSNTLCSNISSTSAGGGGASIGNSCSSFNRRGSSSLRRRSGALDPDGGESIRTFGGRSARRGSECGEPLAGSDIAAGRGGLQREGRPEPSPDDQHASWECGSDEIIAQAGGHLAAHENKVGAASLTRTAAVRRSGQTCASNFAEQFRAGTPNIVEGEEEGGGKVYKAPIQGDERCAARVISRKRLEWTSTALAAAHSQTGGQTETQCGVEMSRGVERADNAASVGAGSTVTRAAHPTSDTLQVQVVREMEEEDEEGVGAPAAGASFLAAAASAEDADEEEQPNGRAYTFIRYTVPRREMF